MVAPALAPRTYLVECFGASGSQSEGDGLAGGFDRLAGIGHGLLATLAIADDEQLLVLVRGEDATAVARRCVAAGLTVDRIVEVALSPAWRWEERIARRRQARASPR